MAWPCVALKASLGSHKITFATQLYIYEASPLHIIDKCRYHTSNCDSSEREEQKAGQLFVPYFNE